MIVILSSLIGASLGAAMAKRRGGNGKDIAQYAAVLAMIGAVLGLFATIIVERSLT